MRNRLGNRLVWAALLALIAVLGVAFRDNIEDLYRRTGELTVVDDPAARTVRLEWRGKIEAPMAARLAEALGDWSGKRERIVLSLASPGGSAEHGGEVIRLLRAARRSVKLETFVGAGERCLSMCVPVYLQGEVRRADPRSRWMFHEVSLREGITHDRVETPEWVRRTSTDRLFDLYFLPAGVDERWMSRMREAMRGRDVWRTGRQLVDEGAGIINSPG